MMYWNDGSVGWAGWLVMTASMAAFWGLLAWVALSLVRSCHRSSRLPTGSTAEELLAERFARGEINQEEYHQRGEVLRREQIRPT